MAIRSFLAFELPVDIKSTIMAVSEDVRQLPLNVRWVNVTNIHLTIVFMGNVQEEQIKPIQEIVRDVCLRYGLSYRNKGFGLFWQQAQPESALDRP